jgi:hypothetical protein
MRGHAEKLHGHSPTRPTRCWSPLSPNQRVLEINTGVEARKRIPDRSAKLAALSYGGGVREVGDLAGGPGGRACPSLPTRPAPERL